MALVILELSGGVIQAVRADDPATEVILLDYDTAEADEPARPFLWEPELLGSDPDTDDRQLVEIARREPPVRRSP